MVLHLAHERHDLWPLALNEPGADILFVIAEIESSLCFREDGEQACVPAFGARPQTTGRLAQSLTPLRFGLGIDEIREPLSFGKIELAVIECPPREFARLCRSQSLDCA